jgi:hypothetical protein
VRGFRCERQGRGPRPASRAKHGVVIAAVAVLHRTSICCRVEFRSLYLAQMAELHRKVARGEVQQGTADDAGVSDCACCSECSLPSGDPQKCTVLAVNAVHCLL